MNIFVKYIDLNKKITYNVIELSFKFNGRVVAFFQI